MSSICGIYSPREPTLASRDILNGMMAGRIGNLFVDEEAGIAFGHVPSTNSKELSSGWHLDDELVSTLAGEILNTRSLLRMESQPRSQQAYAIAAAACFSDNTFNFPEDLDGHFGLAIWDRRERSLWLVRDALGGKPLYYFHVEHKGLVIFASKLDHLLRHPAVDRRLSLEAVTAFLTFGYVPAPLSMFEGIHKAFPGEVLKIDADGSITKRRFWNVPPFEPKMESLDELAAPLREQVVDTVAKHVQGAQRVGVYLSGGVDSTIVLGVLKLLGVPERITFTLGSYREERKAQDLYWAQQVTKSLASRHYPICIDEDDEAKISLQEVLRQFDEPVITSNRALSNCLMAAVARDAGAEICLTGHNAEYLFGIGSWKKVYNLPETVRESMSEEELIFFSYAPLFSFKEQKHLLARPLSEPQEVVMSLMRRYREQVQTEDLYEIIANVQMLMEGAEKMIMFQERTGDLSGVEVRYPFHDARLLKFTNRIPSAFKGSHSTEMKRAALKLAFNDVLPHDLANRRKAGYPIHLGKPEEIKNLKQRLLSPANLEWTGLFKPAAVQQILESDEQSGKPTGWQTWALLAFQAWCEFYLRSGR